MKTDNNEQRARRLRRNRPLVLWLGFCQVFMVFMPIAVPFFQSKGLSMQEVFSLQALFAVLVLISEVPSGYIADFMGRRRTLILGGLFVGIGHSLLLVATDFWTLALFEAALAIGHSLVSGADVALAYDTEVALVEEEGKAEGEEEAKGGEVIGKLFSARTGSEAAASVVCSLMLLNWDMDGIVWLQAAVGWLPFVLAFALIEPPVQRLAESSHLGAMRKVLVHLWHDSQVLRLCILALSIWPLTTFYAVWLIQEHWQQQGISLVHFGYLWGALSLVAALAGRYAQAIERRLGLAATMALLILLPVVGYLGMASAGLILGLLAASTFSVARGVGLVMLRDALNRRVPSEFRATANSVASFGFRAGFVVTGPLVGYVYDWWGMITTLVMLAALSLVLGLSLLLPLVFAVRRPDEALDPSSCC